MSPSKDVSNSSSLIAAVVAIAAVDLDFDTSKSCNRFGRAARTRRQRSVLEMYEALGPVYFRRAHRMSYESFCILHNKLKEGIVKALGQRNAQDDLHGNLPPTPNGRISTTVRLACALRYFAGGSPYDIMINYGVSHTDIFSSVWSVVEAINQLEQFFIIYPASHDKQRQIAAGFHAVSQAGIDNCAGALDGILIYIHKPTLQESRKCRISQLKFFCGRKISLG